MILPEFTLLIDGKDIKSFNMALIGYELQSYIGRKTTGIDIPGAHGTQLVPSALSSNGFSATVICTGENSSEVHNQIRQFFAYMFSTHEQHEIIFTDDMEVIRYAILDSPNNYNVVRGVNGAMAEIKLQFYMADPFTYQNYFDKIVKIAEYGEDIQITNDSYECPAIYTLENVNDVPVTGISLVVNDEKVTYSCILNKGDKIVLDTIEYEVKLNDEVRLDYWEGEMPILKNGNNLIYQHNTELLPLFLTVEFKKQWV